MDPYAATQQPPTYQPTPTPSSQIQQDPYIYTQQPPYDPYSYYSQPVTYDQSQSQPATYAQYQPTTYDQYQTTTYDQSQQYVNPSVYQQQSTTEQQQENAPIHPPGVPVQPDTNQMAAYQQQQEYAQTYYQTDPNSYYYAQPQVQPQPVAYPDPNMVHSQWQQPEQQQQQPPQPQQQHHGQPGSYGLTSMYPPNGQGGQPSGPSRGGGRGFRGGSSSSLRGRGRGGSGGGSVGRGGGGGGRGGGGGGHGSGGRGGGGRGGSSSRGGGRGGRPAVSQPKPQFLARCELCRVDCNTVEVFENHKNGKKHKKNLEIQEEFKRLAGKTQPEIEAMNAAAASEQPPEVKVKDESQTVDSEELLANSMKRKMMEEERNFAEPNKRLKEAVPFICELCDVKCESAPVFDCHLKGRKHLFNLQRFQEQEARLGQVALQALYPALEAALYPVLIQALAQTASTSYPYGGLDQQVLQLLQPYLPQTGPPMYPPGPGYRRHGPNPGVTLQEVESQVEPVSGPESKTGDQEGPENKTEDQVNPENGTKDQVNPENGTKDQVKPENETEDQVEPKNETEGQVEPENETEDQVEPENETEDQVEPELKTEEVDSNAGESTQ